MGRAGYVANQPLAGIEPLSKTGRDCGPFSFASRRLVLQLGSIYDSYYVWAVAIQIRLPIDVLTHQGQAALTNKSNQTLGHTNSLRA
jgi:hypothetical protein